MKEEETIEMLRPDDRVELRRTIMHDSVARLRGKDLKQVKQELNMTGRTNSDQVGWVAAFTEYPYPQVKGSEEYSGGHYKSLDGEITYIDVVDGVRSDTGKIQGYQSKSNLSGYVYNGQFHEVNIECLRDLIDHMDEFSPEHVTIRESWNLDQVLTECVKETLHQGIAYLISTAPEVILQAALTTLLDQTPEQIAKAYTVSKRLGHGGKEQRAGYYGREEWYQGIANEVRNRMPGSYQKGLTLRQLLSFEPDEEDED